MSELSYDMQYMDIAKLIWEKGAQELNKRTGIITRRIPGVNMRLDLEENFPLLRLKYVNWKSALKEILWIMQTQSNNINDLDSNIWNEWADRDGSIGKAYGYQIKKHHQIDRVLKELSEDPSSREGVIDLWQCDDLDEMNLNPCCYSSHFTIINGRLNCTLMQRSGDWMLGVPFNTFQYGALTTMMAHCLGVRPGIITHNISDAHIYENHSDGFYQLLDRFNSLYAGGIETNLDAKYGKPEVKLREGTPTNFYDISIDDFIVIYDHGDKISFKVAV